MQHNWVSSFSEMIRKRVWPIGLKNIVSLDLKGEKYVIHQLPSQKGYRVYVELGEFEKMKEAVECVREDADSQ